jgi:hypothetical protein
MAEVVKIEVEVSGDGAAAKKVKDIKKDLQDTGKAGQEAADGIKRIAPVALDVRQRLRDLQNRMAEIGDVGSKEFQDLAREAGGLKDQMNNANAAIKSMSADFPKLQLGVQGLQAMGAAAQAATGFQALLGTENEEITKSIQKMMAVQALSNSLMQFSNLLSDESALGLAWRKTSLFRLTKQVKAYNIVQKVRNVLAIAFNKITKGNPIIKLILVVGALITAMIALAKNIKKVGDFFSWLGDIIVDNFTAQMKFLGILDKEFETIGQRERRLRAEKAAARKEEAQAHKARMKEIKEQGAAERTAIDKTIKALELKKDTLEAEGKSSDEVTVKILQSELAKSKSVLKENLLRLTSQMQYYEALAALNGQNEEDFKESMKRQGTDLDKLLADRREQIKADADNVQLAENDITEFKRQQAEKRAGNVKTNLNEENKAKEDALKAQQAIDAQAAKDAEARQKEAEKAADDLFNRRVEARDKLAKMERDKNADEAQLQLNALEDEHVAEMEVLSELIPEENELRLALEQEYLEARQTILDDAAAIEKEKKDEERKQLVEDVQQSGEALLSIAKSFNSITTSRDIKRLKDKQSRGERLTKSEIKRLEREEKVQKAFAIAQVAIDTARGISAAVAAGAGLVFPANIPAILAGVSAVIGGVAQANTILGESSSIDVGGASSSVGDISNDVTDNAQPPLRTIESGSTLLNPEPQVVVVVEDINQGQNSVAVIESQASFG